MEHYIGEGDRQIADWSSHDLSHDSAVAAQMMAVNQYLDIPITDTHAMYDAMAHGWLTAGGSSSADVGKLFDLYEVPYHRVDGASIGQLVAELQEGHRVV